MNYEFHVGDYVEAAGGAKGYICDANKDWWYCTNADDEHSVGYVYRIVRLGSGGIDKCYKRIGAYDFTKKEKKKIARLSEDDSWLTFRNTNKANVNLCYIIKRIHEIVDAVNLLLDKSTES